MTELNRKKPYARIYGNSEAAFYQDGNYFNGQGKLVSQKRASQPYGLTQSEVEELEEEEALTDEAIVSDSNPEEGDDEGTDSTGSTDGESGEGDAGPEGTEPEPAILPDPANPPSAEWTERYEELKGEHHRTLKDMCAEAYEAMKAQEEDMSKVPHAPFTGEGSSELNARWLATYVIPEEDGQGE